MELRILGNLDVIDRDGRSVDVRGTKLRTVLAMLVLRAGQPVSSDQLADALWGDDPPDGAANALQAHVSKLRRALEPGMLEATDGAYTLVAPPSSIDANEFSRLAATGREELRAGRTRAAAATLREALALWRGPPLAEFDTADFATADRVRLDELRLLTFEDLVEAELAEQRHDVVVPELENVLADHPLRERLWGQLMIALYRSGRQADALRAFQRARDVLAEELGLDPGPALRELERQVLDHDPTIAAEPIVTPARARAVLTNVRPELTSFVGRREELDSIAAAVRDRRLVTLVGPGGVGKTRLACEIALRSAASWPDGTWLVELGTEIGDGAVARAFAHAFGDRLGMGDAGSLDWLADGLGAAQLLIVLDNCEHVAGEVAGLVETILRACPEVHVLATSREPLGCAGESIRPVEPLPIDDAVELFASRAADASADFRLGDDTADDVDAICAQLDRLPLAIELTAARARVFSTGQLASMLAERFALASTDSPTRPMRQRTMHAAVDWSYDLLFEGERQLLARLAVFSGGFTLAAAVAVCTDDDLQPDDVQLTIARLVDRSLVTVSREDDDGAGGRRYRLLRPVAEYAIRRLDEAGRTGAFRDRHLAWLVSATDGLTAGLRGADALTWAARANAEVGNVGQAVQWSLDGGDPVAGLALLVNHGWYAFLSANLHRDEASLLEVLDRATDAPPTLRCRGMMWAGILSIGNSDRRTPMLDAIDVARMAGGAAHRDRVRVEQRRGVELTLDSIALARTLEDPGVLMEALAIGGIHLAAVATSATAVTEIAEELGRLAAASGDGWDAAMAEALRGLGAYVGTDLRAAIVHLTDAIRAFNALGDAGTACLFDISWSEVAELIGDVDGATAAMARAQLLGSTARFRSATILRSVLCWLTARTGDIERALVLGRDAVAEAHRPFNPVIRAQALFALGVAEGLHGSLDLAQHRLEEALGIHERIGMTREAAMDHRHLGFIAHARGDVPSAFRHHDTALRLAVELGLPWTVMLVARGMAEALMAVGRVEQGCVLLGAADDLGARHDYPPAPDEVRYAARARAVAVAAIGEEAVEAAWAAGRGVEVPGMLALVEV